MRDGGRRSIRLRMHDYCSIGYYFVTICTKDRLRLFGHIKNGKMNLSKYGEIAERFLQEIPNHFPNVVVDEFIIMPDHVHAMIHIKNHVDHQPAHTPRAKPDDANGDGGAQHAAPLRRRWRTNHSRVGCVPAYGVIKPGSLSAIIRSYKSAVTREARLSGFDGIIWQRNYHETIIRNETHLFNARRYIINNVNKWNEDLQNLKKQNKNPPLAP